MARRVWGRGITWFAVSVLLLDGIGLLAAGAQMHRRGLVIGGLVCLVVALGVVVLWKRQQQLLADVEEARVDLAHQARNLRSLVRSDSDQN